MRFRPCLTLVPALLFGIFHQLNARAQSQGDQPVTVPPFITEPPRSDLLKRRSALLVRRDSIKADVAAHNGKYSSVPQGSALEAAGRADLQKVQAEISAYSNDVREFNKSVVQAVAALPPAAPSQGLPTDALNDEAARILAGIRKIKVPPPIPAEDAAISFGQVVPDERAERIIMGSEIGVAILDISGKLGNASLPSKLLFATGKTFIAAENGADVYLVAQNDTCEKALAYLKDEKTRQKFALILKDVRENKPLPEDASIDMARAAQTILDPKLGNSGMHMAWDAMLSPEARHAALTQACIELGGHAVGKASEALVGRLMAARQPAFEEATDFLAHAHVALEKVKDPKAIESLLIGATQANDMISQAYHVSEPAAKAGEHVGHLLFTHGAEKALEKPAKE